MSVNNTCECPNPPGGRAVCEPHQLAICIVKDGQARQECHNPPNTPDTRHIVNSVLTTVTGIHHANDAYIDASDSQMLLQGTYERETGELVTFALPQAVKQAVQDIARKASGRASSASSC